MTETECPGRSGLQDVQIGKGKGNKNKGSFSYSDPGYPLVFSTSKITNVVITGNHAQFSGTAKTSGKQGQKISFTVDVTDNGDPGFGDTFSISVSSGYSASGTITGGNIQIH